MSTSLSALSLKEWQKVQTAVKTVEDGVAKRIDGDGWKVYLAGTIIRIDITVSQIRSDN